ncbi:hypothetical protein BM221_006079 [Beauveria bassiana]|uniref:Uncharacterized protein n=1 Tax=Beauveria bassiana TaxID=176275 RepID=A0A2N6NKX5_BEABA|nr:hypothetical protein BM221_006079 [Beauveria bassiana]
MAEASDASSVAIDTVLYLARSLWSVRWSRHLARLARLLALPLTLVTVPLSYIVEVLRVLCAPLLYLLAFAVASAQGVLSLLASLKLSAAAGVGIVAGVVLGATSSVVTSYLGMQDTDEDRYQRERDYIDSYESDEGTDYQYDLDTYQLHAAPAYQTHLRRSSDPDATPKRRVARGLLSQTIHEEDDSSDA